MNLKHVGVIYQKELREALRDRRTLISAILIPMILFPVVMTGFGFLAAHSVRKVREEGVTVMVLGAEHSPGLVAALRKAEGVTLVSPAADFATRIGEKKLRVAVEIPKDFEARVEHPTAEPPSVRIYFYTGEMRSQFAVRTVQKTLREYADAVVEKRLAARSLSPQLLKPFVTSEENVAPPEKVGGNALGGLIPYMIIFLCFVGAMAAAMDVTAGEKERGAIETILATPVDRTDLVGGKFLLVLTMSIVTSIIALSSFAVTFGLPFAWVRRMSSLGGSTAPFDISPVGIAAVFCLVVPVAVMFSAGLLAVSSLAKSSKEAQSYISPLMMVVVMPAMAALLPGFDLNLKWAFVPILNVSLVSKELLTGVYPWGLLGIVFLSSCAYATAALLIAVLVFPRNQSSFGADQVR